MTTKVIVFGSAAIVIGIGIYYIVSQNKRKQEEQFCYDLNVVESDEKVKTCNIENAVQEFEEKKEVTIASIMDRHEIAHDQIKSMVQGIIDNEGENNNANANIDEIFTTLDQLKKK